MEEWKEWRTECHGKERRENGKEKDNDDGNEEKERRRGKRRRKSRKKEQEVGNDIIIIANKLEKNIWRKDNRNSPWEPQKTVALEIIFNLHSNF